MVVTNPMNNLLLGIWLSLALLAAGRPLLPPPGMAAVEIAPPFWRNPALAQELLLPDLRTLPPYELRLAVDAQGGREIRFSNAVWNAGAGPLEVRGRLAARSGGIHIDQRVYRGNGAFTTFDRGELIFHHPHDHWHWEGFSIYEVWSVTADGSLGELLASSDKVSYCMRDDTAVESGPRDWSTLPARQIPDRPRYLGCGWQLQGISAGWSDIYIESLPGQAVDISDLPDGLYALKSTVNPEGLLAEADTTNNAAITFFALREGQVQMIAVRAGE